MFVFVSYQFSIITCNSSLSYHHGTISMVTPMSHFLSINCCHDIPCFSILIMQCHTVTAKGNPKTEYILRGRKEMNWIHWHWFIYAIMVFQEEMFLHRKYFLTYLRVTIFG